MTQTISKRLRAAADFVRAGAFVADVGTDHAYLPIYLAKTGKIRGGVASDINEGPYLCAKKNIAAEGLSDILTACHTAGLSGIEEFSPTDIMVCGMGGELIANILDGAPWVKNEKIRLILQPMTHPELLREYLSREGFEISRELLVSEDKIYHIICAEYSGEPTKLDHFEALFGKGNLNAPSEELYALLRRTRDIYSQRIAGKMLSGADSDYENEIIAKIDEFMKKETGK